MLSGKHGPAQGAPDFGAGVQALSRPNFVAIQEKNEYK
jgi:hypothetical protein